VQIKLEAVGNGSVINLKRQSNAPDKLLAGQAGVLGNPEKLLGAFSRMFAAAAANMNSEFMSARVQPALERTHDGSSDS